MKKFSAQTVVAIGIGTALFFVLGHFVKVPSPVPSTNIFVQYGLLAFFSVVYGPVAGALVGFIGHTLVDMAGGGPWWSWIIASAVFGLIMGFACKNTEPERGKIDKKVLVSFNVSQLVAHSVCWGVVAPLLDILWYSEPVEKVFSQGLVAGVANAVTTAIVGSVLCVAYSSMKVKADSSLPEKAAWK